VPVKKALDDAMIGLYQNGERLMPGNGYPMRLLLPGYQGNMNVKFLRRLKLTEGPAMSYYEGKIYSQLLPDGKAYRFHFLQEVKSFITHPSFGLKMNGPGYYEISGIAYSGNGRISRVMVSADGGKTWAQAALQEPVHSKAFARFRAPWRWNGGSAVLQSRAWDEAGNAQPTRAEFVPCGRDQEAGYESSRVSQPALQQHHELGDRQRWGDQTCLRLSWSSPLSSRSS